MSISHWLPFLFMYFVIYKIHVYNLIGLDTVYMCELVIAINMIDLHSYPLTVSAMCVSVCKST